MPMSNSFVFTDKVTVIPSGWLNDVNVCVFDIFRASTTPLQARQALGLGNIATQNTNGIVISGGFIDATPIGSVTPDTGVFTTLRASGTPSVSSDVVTLGYLNTAIANLSGGGGGGGAPAVVTTKGDLYTYNNQAARLAVGTDGQVLTADSATPTGLRWVTPATQLPLTAKGDLLAFTGSANVRLPVGPNGYTLSANSAAATGLAWIPTYTNPINAKGQLATGDVNGTTVVLNPGADNYVLVADSTASLGVKWASISSVGSGYTPPVTTKGDIFVYGNAGATRLPVGTDNLFLVADATQATGLRWGAAPQTTLPLSAKGDILVRDASTAVRLPVGTNGQILSADSNAATGLAWIAAPSGGGGSAFNRDVVATSSNLTLAAGDVSSKNPIILADASSANVTVTMPAWSSFSTVDSRVTIHRVGASNDNTVVKVVFGANDYYKSAGSPALPETNTYWIVNVDDSITFEHTGSSTIKWIRNS